MEHIHRQEKFNRFNITRIMFSLYFLGLPFHYGFHELVVLKGKNILFLKHFITDYCSGNHVSFRNHFLLCSWLLNKSFLYIFQLMQIFLVNGKVSNKIFNSYYRKTKTGYLSRILKKGCDNTKWHTTHLLQNKGWVNIDHI